ncbi:glycosyltransferase family 4 protein [Marinobacter nauticus]
MNTPPVKVLVISHALVIPVFRRRWENLALDKNYEVHLLVPEYWEQTWFSEKVIYKTEETHNNNFHLHTLPTTSVKNWGIYLFKSVDAKFREIKPDVIYIVHEEGILIHQQIYLYRALFSPNSKIIFFSMNARGIPGVNHRNFVKRWIAKFMWRNIKKNTEAALVHYPGCVNSLRSGGYNKPIFIQTQVGVDEELFKSDPALKAEYRNRIKAGQNLIIGYAGRLVEDKGVDDLLAAFLELARENPNISLLLVGNGALKAHIMDAKISEGLGSRIHVTGFIDQAEVPGYMNAMDIFVLGSKTMPTWIDTFPLVTVQAQSCEIPVLASNSASIPWQLSDSALLYNEGDEIELKYKLREYIENEALREYYAEKGKARSREYFCHQGMTQNFKHIIGQVLNDNYVYHDEGEQYTQWKAY